MTHLIGHPRWCSPRYCGVVDTTLPADGGEHRSEPIGLDLRSAFTVRGQLRVASAYLTQAEQPWTTDTYLHLETDGDDLTMPLPRAAGVLAQLIDLIREGSK